MCFGLVRDGRFARYSDLGFGKRKGGRRELNRDSDLMGRIHATTVLSVRHKGKVVMAGDGQVSLEHTIMKHTARKVRRIYHDKVLGGFAGATADAFTLFTKFEEKLDQFSGNLLRAAVELA